jgi:hypothetical protein
MRRIKSAILGLACLISVLLGGCLAAAPPQLGDPPQSPSPVLADAVLPYGGLHSSCSAVAIEPHTLTTARHCLDHIGAGWVLVPKREPYVVTDGWHSNQDDVALLHVADDLPVVSPVATYLPHIGDLGYVAGYGCDSTQGMQRLGVRPMRYLGRDSFGTFWYAGSACHGDSGGGVFDESGALIGVTVLVNTDEGPVTSVGVEPLAGVLDGLAHEDDGAGWRHADDFTKD